MRGEGCPWYAFPYGEHNWISLKLDQPFIDPDSIVKVVWLVLFPFPRCTELVWPVQQGSVIH